MTTVRIVVDPDREWARLNFRYDADLVAMVKELSYGVRRYDPESKSWSVHDEHLPRLAEQMTKAGHDVVYGDEPVPVAAVAPRKADPSLGGFFGIDDADTFDVTTMADGLIAQIPTEFHGKVFRAMGRKLYPDMFPKGRR